MSTPAQTAIMAARTIALARAATLSSKPGKGSAMAVVGGSVAAAMQTVGDTMGSIPNLRETMNTKFDGVKAASDSLALAREPGQVSAARASLAAARTEQKAALDAATTGPKDARSAMATLGSIMATLGG